MRTLQDFQSDVLTPLRKERDEKMMATYDRESSLKAQYQREGFIVLIEYHVRCKTAHISIVSIEDFILIHIQIRSQQIAHISLRGEHKMGNPPSLETQLQKDCRFVQENRHGEHHHKEAILVTWCIIHQIGDGAKEFLHRYIAMCVESEHPARCLTYSLG